MIAPSQAGLSLPSVETNGVSNGKGWWEGMAQGKLILVVDDQRGIRLLLEEVLVHYGYRVVTASDGEEALALVVQLQPDLVLLDMNMPGLSGPETLSALRERWPILPVIMVTADEDDSHWATVQKLGVQGRISKPFDLDDLARIVAGAMPKNDV